MGGRKKVVGDERKESPPLYPPTVPNNPFHHSLLHPRVGRNEFKGVEEGRIMMVIGDRWL